MERGAGETAAAQEAAPAERSSMRWSTQVARIAGVPIRVHVTFWLLVVYLWWVASASGANPFQQVGLVLSVFVCILLHELAHVLVARRFGIGTRDVTLYPIGGVSRLESMGEPRQELVISLAGPLLSVLIGGLLWAGLALAGPGVRWGEVFSGRGSFLEWLAVANLTLGAFNLLPAFPSDGGRVLRAALALRLGKDRATGIAAAVGQGFAAVLGLLGLATGNLILTLVAVFLFIGARAEAALQSLLSVARGHAVREAMVTRFERLRPDDPLGVAVERLLRTEQEVFPVLGEDERLVGLLTPSTLVEAVADHGRKDGRVRDAMRPAPDALRPDADLGDVLSRLAGDAQHRPVPVVESDRLVGLLTWQNLMEFLALARAAA